MFLKNIKIKKAHHTTRRTPTPTLRRLPAQLLKEGRTEEACTKSEAAFPAAGSAALPFLTWVASPSN